MLVTTHTMVAMALTVTTGNPLIYLPAALLNHPVLDMVPHFGFPEDGYPEMRKKAMWPMIIGDAVVGTTMFFLVFYHTGLPFLLLFSICVLAGWPDLFTLYQRKVDSKLAPKFLHFHEKIQTESPWFFFVDLLIILTCAWLIFS